ncbi:MAG TPA: Fe-Mn family superoxide dismutase [Candidatus Sumerlaeota bacterium]|nr:Fe-Mn family superoxide dismutase [Candidatus Sumerlaeota bacterium]
MRMTRRKAISTLVAGSSVALVLKEGLAAGEEPAGATGKAPQTSIAPRTPKPLPFDPKKLNGISERLITSHWENNYGSAVKNLSKVEEELGRVTKDTAGFLVSGLRERELTFTNSIILHDLYFGNLGGDGKAGGGIQVALSAAFGNWGRFEELFRATGAALGGGSGWTVLGCNFHTGALGIYWSGHHTQALAFGAPLLVMDMYEHAYQMDYGAAAGKYIEAFFQNINWQEVNRRYERIAKMGALFAPEGK